MESFHIDRKKCSHNHKNGFKKDIVRTSLTVPKDKVSTPYNREFSEITRSDFDEFEKLFNEINRKIDLDIFSYSFDPIINYFSVSMHYLASLTYESPHITSFLGFKGLLGGNSYHNAHKEPSRIHSTLTLKICLIRLPCLYLEISWYLSTWTTFIIRSSVTPMHRF